MSLGIRVRMAPLVSGLGDPGQAVADGAVVALVQLGKPPSQLEPGAQLPASLKFQGRFIERLRGEGAEETKDLATLSGTLEQQAGARIVFTGKPREDGPLGLEPVEAVGDEDDATDDDPREVRLLRFAFDADQFKEVTKDREPLELALRIDAVRFRYFEVSVVLEVDGQTEADAAVNDTLDVFVTARNPTRRELVTVRFTDDTGEPMPSAAVAILSGAKPVDKSADPSALTADARGELRLRNLPGAETCEVAWGVSADQLTFRRKLFLLLGSDASEADERRLKNLGYPSDRALSDNVLSFQADFARPASGSVADVSQELAAFHDDGTRPARGDATEPSSEAIAINGPRSRDFGDLEAAAKGGNDEALA